MPRANCKPLPVLTLENIARFWSKVDKNGPIPKDKPELGPCWVWTDSLTRYGYGRLGIGFDLFFAHRISFLIHNGYDPRPLDILHLCNNPRCVRHITAGTPGDNIRAAYAEGRIKHVRKNPIKQPHELYQYVPPSKALPLPDEKWVTELLNKIDRSPGHGDNKDCHVWTGKKIKGYGLKYIDNKKYAAHRLAYFVEYGIDPGTNLVRHSCHNRECCRKEHLSLGSFEDNMMDKYRANRQAKGDSHGRRTLCKADTLDAKRRYAGGESQKSIAKSFGVCVMTINLAIRGKTFKD